MLNTNKKEKIVIKTILSLKGICQKFTSDYYRDTSKEEEKQIEKALEEFNF